MRIVLPFPPASLAGHNKGHWRGKKLIIADQVRGAFKATENAEPQVPEFGDIPVSFLFVPPNRRGDRVNFPIRIKPAIDGVALALGVNDRRFLPSYHFAAPDRDNPRVEIEIGGEQ